MASITSSNFGAPLQSLQLSSNTRITPAVLNSLLRGDDAPLVWEFRSAETYEAQHVPGSRLVTLDEIAGAAAGLDKGQAIVTLCT